MKIGGSQLINHQNTIRMYCSPLHKQTNDMSQCKFSKMVKSPLKYEIQPKITFTIANSKVSYNQSNDMYSKNSEQT